MARASCDCRQTGLRRCRYPGRRRFLPLSKIVSSQLQAPAKPRTALISNAGTGSSKRFSTRSWKRRRFSAVRQCIDRKKRRSWLHFDRTQIEKDNNEKGSNDFAFTRGGSAVARAGHFSAR